ncbi:UNVERIFIED_CONTAM: hypothetical protein Sradi_0835900 [Sesamum radiatum]|uniref:AB hydrolase-1 domain-containing protein n=1 Tax=Sesamum radiatum TaxID=300843 RepID=A0AAW2V642_SESRA
MAVALGLGFPLHYQCGQRKLRGFRVSGGGGCGADDLGGGFPSFLPKEVHNIRDPSARSLARRIQRLPVQLWKSHIRRPMTLVGPSLGAAVALDFTVNFPEAVRQKALLICSERDNIVSNKLAERLHNELPNASMRKVEDCGHMPHIEKPYVIAQLIADFAKGAAAATPEARQHSQGVDTISCKNKS